MKRVLDWLLPPYCPACGRKDVALCASCRKDMASLLDEPVGAPIGLATHQPAGLAQLEWCAAYNGPARACLHALKYGGELRLVEPLAELMAQRWRRSSIGGELLAAVPVHAQRRRERGFDQAELLARQLSAELRMPLLPALEREARTRAQHKLGRGARAGNVGGVFTVPRRLTSQVSGHWLVLVDDVVTTGATLSACAIALRAAGALAVSALTLARER
jgi:ComF family protein